MEHPLHRDATRILADIRSGQLTAVDLMEATLDRIAQVNPVVNAVVSLRAADALLNEAREADRTDQKGPLHGLPFAVKDLANVAGIATSMGSTALKGTIPDTSDIMVQRIQDAGAIIIGKTNTPEFGLGSHTFNSVFGETQNAHLHGKSAGGSSGGAAVALATHMVALADGSDMMGSLRNPAGWNGVYGLRPTWGRVPSEPRGDTYLHQLATNGPMARTPSDLALLLDVQSGPDSRQPLSRTAQPTLPEINAGRSLRLAWLGDWGGAYAMEPGVIDTCTAAMSGYDVADIGPPFPAEQLWDAWITLRSWSVAQNLGPLYTDKSTRNSLKPEAIWEVERGLALSLVDVERASLIRSNWFSIASKLFEIYDGLVLPTAQCFPFPISWDWPKEIAGRKMDTYHRWMEVVVPASLIGLPALAVPIPGQHMGLQIIGRQDADLQLLQFGLTWHSSL
ncbi:amidase [Cognatiyoonia koreensis]|uniref:Amidase n=1 Tax=Cognatiyoonia koreensis TaxID=364200 RepID=A0A1I0PNW8_9RHOB|nr:amidase [Cognatiyoonia koreensis]SEW16033.1 amidase [Cognatiyoonia koreensis]